MKLSKLAYLLTLAVALSLTMVGCKKGLDKTTQIPQGAKPTVGGETPAEPRGIGQGTTLPPVDTTAPGRVEPITAKPVNENIAASTKNLQDWKENRDEFKAQTVYFDFDKSNVKASEIPKLEEVTRRMKSSFQGKGLKIEGHCDERGTEEYNRALGDKRAQTVREKLVSLGMDPELVMTISFGEERPVDHGHTEAAWRKNRRGEIILLTPPGAP